MAKFVMWGSYCEDVLEKRSPYRADHLAGLKSQQESGVLVALGPTVDNTKVFGIYEAADEAIVRQLIEGDPYWRHGIWMEYEVYAWNQVF
jgi:uncharacterized protein YciI